MKVEQIYTNCLAQGSYYIESNGEAAVIDPLRDTFHYTELAQQSNSKIKYVFETHFHADFISGHVTLAKITDSDIIYGPNADPDFPCTIAEDNQVFTIGDISITVLHTPGHTLESSCFLLKDETGKEHCLFTGDTLFLGDVGRPDLAQKKGSITKEELAGILYDSVNKKIKPLPGDVIIYPGHGAGSQCGKNMMKETVDTLENQKNINYVLNGSLSKEEFIHELTHDLVAPPAYFPANVKLNKEGYNDLSSILEKSNKPLSAEEFEDILKEEKVIVLDVRHQDDFANSHIPNSIFVGLDGGFAPWVGSVISDVHQSLLLVVDNNRVEEAITRLSRVGFDNVIGFLDGGIVSWKNANKETESIATITAQDFEERITSSESVVFDVRGVGEYQSEHIIDAINIPLNDIGDDISEFRADGDSYIHCAGGYRSIIAHSILKSRGIHNLIDVKGGFSSIKKTDIPTRENTCSN
jgi:glyoxylase-like metal-dependent hydrolase (beta-lactamase superfamily II)/rhodanese-related sulfurtransferase